jgi:two-component system sensor histidine kinase CpxA
MTKKILLLALVNAIALAAVFVLVVAVYFGGNLGTLLIAVVRSRAVDLTTRFVRDFEGTPQEDREALAARYRQESGFDFYVYTFGRKQLSGHPLPLPPEVNEHMQGLPIARLVARQADQSLEEPVLSILAAARGAQRKPFFVKASGPIPYWVGVVSLIQLKEVGRPMPSVVLFAFPSLGRSPLAGRVMAFIGVILLGAFASVVCWVPLIRGLNVSVARMKHATEEIAGGRFDVAIEVNRRDDVGELARAIGRMGSRLENLVRGQRRFFGDIAHELRTPIGRMRVALEIAEQDADERQAGHLSRFQRELDLMSDITDQFITLAKSEMRHGVLEPVRIGEIVDRVVQVESDGQTEIRVNVDSGLAALAHSEYLFRSLSNLLRNSLRYAARSGPIDVSAERKREEVAITVADCGPGVPENDLGKIFEPFYRSDDSRDRRTGGVGLGLAIVRSCVEACQGTIECRNRSPHGLAVTIKLRTAGLEPSL